MNCFINGKETPLADGTTVSALLAELNLLPEAVVAELNTEVLKRDLFGSTTLADGDHLEVLSFVGGG